MYSHQNASSSGPSRPVFLRLSAIRYWLARRAIGDNVGVGLNFSQFPDLHFDYLVVWNRRELPRFAATA